MEEKGSEKLNIMLVIRARVKKQMHFWEMIGETNDVFVMGHKKQI